MKNKTIGIVGGMGPLATIKLQEYIYNYSTILGAKKDQDHFNVITINDPSVPDRTDYIFNNSLENPSILLKKHILDLTRLNSNIILIPCNTAMNFYNDLISITNIEILNIIDETVEYIKRKNIKKVAILATSGTIKSKLYQNKLKQNNIQYFVLDNESESILMNLIYEIKSGNLNLDLVQIKNLIYELTSVCDRIVLGCTELSLIKDSLKEFDEYLIDSLEILAISAVDKVKD